ncbi:MAG: beta-galactosidase [Oscillospiraceae bacterium]|nr:beta-galactosidase [Oscillospiraceae bacterium]
MWLGVDYYPEQWDSGLMEADLETMIELGCNVIRIAEFAWHLMEPVEGSYDFSFFDSVIAKAKEKGLSVILGTPTAAIPAWLAKRYPEVLGEYEGGRKRAYGSRHVNCLNSPAFRRAAEGIVQAMVEHYRDEPQVIAWQVDNECGHEGSDVCYCPRCHAAFQQYLARKFCGDIDTLNETYGTAFWSQGYNSFDEIPLPTESNAAHNPALRLDWERFCSESWCEFIAFQVNLIKSIAPQAVVIHDFPGGGLEKHVDFSRAAQPLDVAAYNNYPVWGGQKEPLPPHEIAFGLDYIRGLKGQNFWITEAIMGAQGHDVIGYLPRPNQAALWSYQSLAHGCSSLLYFRYRGATKGAEQFCLGILDADNVKGRKFREVQQVFQTIAPYAQAMQAPIKSQVAMLYDFDSLAAFRVQRQSLLLDCQQEMKKLYRPFFNRNVPVDIVPHSADLSGYQILFMPLMIIARPELQEKAARFVEEGGTLVLTYRTALKDEDNNLVFGQAVPVGYTELAGVRVAESESLQEENAFPVVGQGRCAGAQGSGGIFRDLLEPAGAEVLYHYGDPFYAQYAAVTRHSWGQGTVYYLGCSLDRDTTDHLIEGILTERQIQTIPSDPGVEVAVRGEEGQQVRLYLNHNSYDAKAGNISLPPFACKLEPVEKA